MFKARVSGEARESRACSGGVSVQGLFLEKCIARTVLCTELSFGSSEFSGNLSRCLELYAHARHLRCPSKELLAAAQIIQRNRRSTAEPRPQNLEQQLLHPSLHKEKLTFLLEALLWSFGATHRRAYRMIHPKQLKPQYSNPNPLKTITGKGRSCRSTGYFRTSAQPCAQHLKVPRPNLKSEARAVSLIVPTEQDSSYSAVNTNSKTPSPKTQISKIQDCFLLDHFRDT